jgi:hypothetical protein
MTPRQRVTCHRERRVQASSPFVGFQRSRLRLWALSALGVLTGAVLHDCLARSLAARLLWLAAVALSVAAPLRRLLGFRCPRCRGIFLATGRWRDFLTPTRVLWAKQCGRCALSVVEEEPPSSGGLPESRSV